MHAFFFSTLLSPLSIFHLEFEEGGGSDGGGGCGGGGLLEIVTLCKARSRETSGGSEPT